MRIGIDAMGGDHAPAVEVRGALAARELLGDADEIVLVGRESAIREQMAPGEDKAVRVRHAEQVIGMNEAPVEALRSKPDSSLAVLTQMHADGELDACISAGNTGAFVAAAQMRLRRLAGVHRPGIAILTPTPHGAVSVCDVGANVNSRPQHLHQYGLMSGLYVRAVLGVDNPRVGLLSIGEEEAKGNELVKRARELMKEDSRLNFVGNVEGRDLFRGVCDAIVCDGFVGNVVLKLVEGMGAGVIQSLLEELSVLLPDGREAVQRAGASMLAKYDFNEYGGAPLLGVAGICMICHGAGDARSIANAVVAAKDFARHQLNRNITQLLSEGERAVHA